MFTLNNFKYIPRLNPTMLDYYNYIVNNNCFNSNSIIEFSTNSNFTDTQNNTIFNYKKPYNLSHFFNSLNCGKYKLKDGSYSSIHPEILKKYNII